MFKLEEVRNDKKTLFITDANNEKSKIKDLFDLAVFVCYKLDEIEERFKAIELMLEKLQNDKI